MIKEYVENLPGGKDYIEAQNSINGLIGVAIGIISSASIMIAMDIRGSSFMDKVSVYAIITLVVIVVGIILYYYFINKADNKYMSVKLAK